MVSLKVDGYDTIEIEESLITNLDMKILDNTFCKKRKVPDVIRYHVIFNNGTATITKNTASDFKCSRFIDIKIPDKIEQSIVLIIESPHVDEYTGEFLPIAPAQGTTGRNIYKYLKSILENHYNLLNPESYFDNIKYPLIIANAIQWQTSLGSFRNSVYSDSVEENKDDKNKEDKKKTTLKKEICTQIWDLSQYQDTFLNRVKNYNPVIIINSCTKDSGIKDKTNEVLGNIDNISLFTISHPCNWMKEKDRKLEKVNTSENV